MNKYIARFEALGNTTNHAEKAFKDAKITIRDLNSMISSLEKCIGDNMSFNSTSSLLTDLERSRDKNWKDIRDWKLKSFLQRYEKEKKLIDKIELVEDYFLELSDSGYIVKVDISNYIVIKPDASISKSKSNLDIAGEVLAFLVHLNKTNRVNISLETIDNLREFVVKYSIGNTPLPNQNKSNYKDMEDDEEDGWETYNDSDEDGEF